MTNSEPLSEIFSRLIANLGPISVMHYMGEANARYYAARDPLGAAGDFVTAPEISQMFGELIGLWLADIWTRAGLPAPVHYVELGPGRGTLARDALRAAARAGLVPEVHFVEGSPALRAIQAQAVPHARWHDDLAGLPGDGPILLVANEFLDALPVRQMVRAEVGWRERMVGHDGGRFLPVVGDRPMDAAVPAVLRDAEPGTIIETCPGAAATVAEVAMRLAAQGGAALFIDYGYAGPATGDTLQALKGGRFADALETLGEADISAHVDFAAIARAAAAHARVFGPEAQGLFLNAIGLPDRAEALKRLASLERRAEIEAARVRLCAAGAMGRLFQVLGIIGRDWPVPAGFPTLQE